LAEGNDGVQEVHMPPDQTAGPAPQPAGYPAAWEFDGLMANGTAVHVRPIRPDDARALVGFHAGLSPDTVYRRYFGVHPELSDAEVRHLTEVDYRDRMAFVAFAAGRLIAVARYDRVASPTEQAGGGVAELAFVVADEFQRHGVATLLFEALASYARTFGISSVFAEVLAGNSDMLAVFGATGLHGRRASDSGVVRVEIDLTPTAEYAASCDLREATAEAASIEPILRPRSVAVVGAGRRPGNAGHEIVSSLVAGGFRGALYPVNPKAAELCGVRAYASLAELPSAPDLVIVAVPPGEVRGVLDAATGVGARGCVVVTAGFGETGAQGARAEAELLGMARRSGMRIVGPNCLGVVNTDPAVRLNATFAGIAPPPGSLGLVSQSGALGIVLARQAHAAGIGLSGFISVGNKLDVSSNDVLCFLERDDRTSVVALYLESFGNPRKFARIARRISASKPIVALTAGRSPAGARGARSHTAAAATPDVIVSALLEASGVVKVSHMDELIDVASLLLTGKLPAGGRVALVGNSGGPLILAADACAEEGLVVPELSAPLAERLKAIGGPSAAVANPVDLTADGGAAAIGQALELLAADPECDAVIVVVTTLPSIGSEETFAVLEEVAARSDKPVLACVFGEVGGPAVAPASPAVARFSSPERAVAALGHLTRYAAWRRRNGEPAAGEGPRAAPVRSDAVRAILERCPSDGWLDLDDAAELLSACGVPVVATRGAASAEEAVAVAQEVGFPVVLKSRSGQLVHKSELGGVVVGLESADAVRAAYDQMAERLGSRMGGAVIQPMAASGVEAIVGAVSDPLFGPVVMVGLGGVLTDLIGDRAFGMPPLEGGQAEQMVASLRTAALLDGFRGSPRADRQALVELLDRVGRVAAELPEVADLDLNPVIVGASGAVVVDCKVRLASLQPGPGQLFRSLRGARPAAREA
jgi:acyl-CoA synthetase (NDP forming)/GNAT superfamily N-acetyltransferase